MALLKKLFGRKDPAVSLRESFQRNEWAEVVRLDDEFSLGAEPELGEMAALARNKLAELNLREAHTRFSQGDVSAGREHLDLAKGYGATDAQILEAGGDSCSEDIDTPAKGKPAAHSCSTCVVPSDGDHSSDVDEALEADWELLLAGLPEAMAQAYMSKSEDFRRALLQGYDGLDEEACEIFRACPEEDRDAHYYYEFGSALCRCDKVDEGISFLLKTVAESPEHRLAWDLLFELNGRGHQVPKFHDVLATLKNVSGMKGFAAANLARISWQQGDREEVLEYGQLAIDEGEAAPDVLQMMAAILEAQENYDQAEMLLSQLPSGGCGGGAHPALAEYWLRREKQLDKALEAFKGSSRQEPDNPRWMLRIAQTYLARGWRREGLKLMNQLAAYDQLEPEQMEEVRQALEEAGKD